MSSQSSTSALEPLRLVRSPAPHRRVRERGTQGSLVAIMVTDLVGFTAVVERLGDLSAQSWIQAHNHLVRSCISRHAGREITHTGDGIMSAFRSVSAALACASDIHARLAEGASAYTDAPLCARIGVHVGEPLPEEDRLFGHCVNTTVRVCAEAGAGRVLVTELVKQLAEARFRFDAAGLRQLKGISAPLALYELAGMRD